MTVVTRFAPSPTGYLHIGGARTALFNWLYARHHDGKFLLRIEDTDKARNDEATIQPILDGMEWLGLDYDDTPVFQSKRAHRHVEVAEAMIANGTAYRCYMGDDEVATQKAANRKTGAAFRSRFRNHTPQNPLFAAIQQASERTQIEWQNGPFVVRFRAPDGGETVIDDLVQGIVTVQNDTIDDLVLLRADGTPTYMLAVVVDDNDAGVNTIIRGDDHLSNAFRQLAIIRSLGWVEPRYGHVPLIHDEAGKKLSKRHGAAGVEFYRDAGFLSPAVFNYLLRMGWGHGDHEIFSRDEAINLFDIDGVGRAPARLDIKRLEHLNSTFLRDCPDDDVMAALRVMGHTVDDPLVAAMVPLVKVRSRTLAEAWSYIEMTRTGPVTPEVIDDPYLEAFSAGLDTLDADTMKAFAERIAEENGVKLKHVVAPIRMAIMGNKVSPPLFEAMALLGRDTVVSRLKAATGR